MAKEGGVLSVTEPPSIAPHRDGLHLTLTSGDRAKTYALSFFDAANLAYLIARLVEEDSREHRVFNLNQRAGAEE